MHTLPVLLSALVLPLAASAQLVWLADNESEQASVGSGSSVSVLVPAGGRITLVTSNFEPLDLSAAGSSGSVTFSFSVTGSLAGIAGGTRPLGAGLFQSGANDFGFQDDAGYFFWANGTAPASIELRRRLSTGTSPSLLNPTSGSFANMGTGNVGSNGGNFADGQIYTVTLRLRNVAGQIGFGSSSLAGVAISGGEVTYGRYTNPETTEAVVFDTFGLMFLNTGASPVTLHIHSIDLTPAAIPEPGALAAVLALAAGSLAWRRRR